MYSGRFIRIEKAATETGLTVSQLIEKGFDGELEIYGWNDWWHFGMGPPFNRYSVDTPILIDDKKHLALLIQDKAARLYIDADGRHISRQDATDDNDLAGVEIAQSDLYCLKSDIEKLQITPKRDDIKTCTQKAKKRDDNLKRAIDAAIKCFSKKPSLEELWKYFQDDKDETGFIVDFEDEKIVWIDTKGKLHDTPKNTLANRLSRVNK